MEFITPLYQCRNKTSTRQSADIEKGGFWPFTTGLVARGAGQIRCKWLPAQLEPMHRGFFEERRFRGLSVVLPVPEQRQVRVEAVMRDRVNRSIGLAVVMIAPGNRVVALNQYLLVGRTRTRLYAQQGNSSNPVYTSVFSGSSPTSPRSAPSCRVVPDRPLPAWSFPSMVTPFDGALFLRWHEGNRALPSKWGGKVVTGVAFAVMASLRKMRPRMIEEIEALAISTTTTPAAA